MPSVVNTNLASLNAQRNLNGTQGMLSQSIQRLSTGLRVNSAKDDAAGLAIAERMTSQIRGMNVAIRNANDGISLAQTAEGALGKVGDMVQRMRELAGQSANSTNSTTDRASLNTEYQQLGAEINRTLAGTQFNGLAILGASAGALAFQVGAGTTANDMITVTTDNMSTDAGVVAATAPAAGITTAGAGHRRNQLARYGSRYGQYPACRLRCDAESIRSRHRSTGGHIRESIRRQQPNHRR